MLLNDIIQKHPAEKTAFIFKNQYTTYGEFRKKVEDWALGLCSSIFCCSKGRGHCSTL